MKVKFSRCNSNNLTNVPIVDGQLIYVKDTKKVYIDVGNDRNDISDFLTKTNTIAFTPTGDYQPSTKKYVDDSIKNYVPMRSFPEGVDITHTTQAFINSIKALNLNTGDLLLGTVHLTDMPDGIVTGAEVKVEVYNNNVIYLTMVSSNVAPYVWTCNSHSYRGWEAAYQAQDTTYDNTSSGMEAETVQGAIDELNNKIGDVGSALDSLNGEVI